MIIKDYSRAVNYYETDNMGIVHHSNYLRYFEEARICFMNQIDCGVKKLEDVGLIIPNVDAYAKYIVPLRFGDAFTVKIKLIEFNGVKFRLEYELINQDDVLCSTGFTTHCFVNNRMKPVSIRKNYSDLFETMKSFVE